MVTVLSLVFTKVTVVRVRIVVPCLILRSEALTRASLDESVMSALDSFVLH